MSNSYIFEGENVLMGVNEKDGFYKLGLNRSLMIVFFVI